MAETAAQDVENQEDQQTEQHQAGPEIVARARRMGWLPEDEYKGDAGNWRTAEKFIERGESEAAIAKERNRALDRELAESHKTTKDLRDTLEQFKDHHGKVEQRAYDRALKDIKAKQRQAVEEGDIEAFDEAAKEADQLRDDATTAAKTEEKPANGADTDQPENPNFAPWQRENAWYGDDIEMTAYADSISQTVARVVGGFGPEFYGRLTQEMKKKFPDRTGNARRRAPASVEGAGDGTNARGGGGKSYADLPPEAKQACESFVKQGLLKQEDYVRDYFEGD